MTVGAQAGEQRRLELAVPPGVRVLLVDLGWDGLGNDLCRRPPLVGEVLRGEPLGFASALGLGSLLLLLAVALVFLGFRPGLLALALGVAGCVAFCPAEGVGGGSLLVPTAALVLLGLRLGFLVLALGVAGCVAFCPAEGVGGGSLLVPTAALVLRGLRLGCLVLALGVAGRVHLYPGVHGERGVGALPVDVVDRQPVHPVEAGNDRRIEWCACGE